MTTTQQFENHPRHASRLPQATSILLRQEKLVTSAILLWFFLGGTLLCLLAGSIMQVEVLPSAVARVKLAAVLAVACLLWSGILYLQGYALVRKLSDLGVRGMLWGMRIPLAAGTLTTGALIGLPALTGFPFTLVIASSLLSASMYSLAREICLLQNWRPGLKALKRQERVWLYAALPLALATGFSPWAPEAFASLLQHWAVILIQLGMTAVLFWLPLHLLLPYRDGKRTAELLSGLTLSGGSRHRGGKDWDTGKGVRQVARYDSSLGAQYLNQVGDDRVRRHIGIGKSPMRRQRKHAPADGQETLDPQASGRRKHTACGQREKASLASYTKISMADILVWIVVLFFVGAALFALVIAGVEAL